MSTIERLHYANGRRLDAGDLRLEQHYHIAMRRLLNKGLFTPGVVNGLEVEKAQNPREVSVKPGLALDPLGRELVLQEETAVAVPNQKPLNRARPGYFLVIRYDELALPGEAHPCVASGAAPEPSRIVERPRLEWTEDWPDHTQCPEAPGSLACAIVLALVTLDDACQVAGVETGSGLREYAYPVHLSQVQAVALEGEKNIDKDNPKVLHFHARGGEPTSVLLYLWGAKFSSLYYTELGNHRHGLGGHTHSLPGASGNTGFAGSHNHRLYISRTVAGGGPYVDSSGAFGNRGYERSRGERDFVEPVGNHQHSISVSFTAPTGGPSPDQSGTVVNGSDVDARAGGAHTYLSDLRIRLDGKDVTNLIVSRYVPTWGKLGDGSAGHPFNAAAGTGQLNLLDLGVDIGHGGHELVFSVASGGGRVLYNLYVS